MHINNESTNRTTLNLTVKLHAQYKFTVWTTCTYKSHTDTWKCHNFKDSSSTYRIEVWWRHCGRLIDVDRTAPVAVAWRCCWSTLLEKCARNVPEISCALESRLLQNARRHLYKIAIVCWRWWRWLLYCRKFYIFKKKAALSNRSWTYRL